MKEEKRIDWGKWKRFLEWVNQLSPWNLWTPQTWSKKDVEKRELNLKVKQWLEEIL